jgi:hypothetical protein
MQANARWAWFVRMGFGRCPPRNLMNRKRATWQLLLVRAVLRRARAVGEVDPDLLARSRRIVDDTAALVAVDGTPQLVELLEAARADVELD